MHTPVLSFNSAFKGKDVYGNLKMGNEYATTSEALNIVKETVHGAMAPADAEAILHKHGVEKGLYLLRTQKCGVYVMTICTACGKRAKFAHHVFEDSSEGFTMNGRSLAQLCTTLEEAIKCVKDNTAKVRAHVILRFVNFWTS